MFQTAAKVDPSPYNGVPYITPAQNGAAYVNMGTSGDQKSFSVGICGIGEVSSCLYSFLLPPCAIASARGQLDGSDCCLNMTHLNPVLLRWITRSAYNIPGSDCEDVLYGLFLPCCTVNQVLQTTSRYGRPFPGVGREANGLPFVAQNNKDCCANCCYATFCLPCAIGTSLNMSMGMPFYMGCCCASYCISRNLLRYQYRLQGQDCFDDCCSPYAIFCGGIVASMFCPCAQCIVVPYLISMVMMMLGAAKDRGNPDPTSRHGSYLHPLPSAMMMSTMLPPGVPFSVPTSAVAAGVVYTTATVQPAPMVSDVTVVAPAQGMQMQPIVMQPAYGGGAMQMQPTVMQPAYGSSASIPYPTAGAAAQPKF